MYMYIYMYIYIHTYIYMYVVYIYIYIYIYIYVRIRLRIRISVWCMYTYMYSKSVYHFSSLCINIKVWMVIHRWGGWLTINLYFLRANGKYEIGACIGKSVSYTVAAVEGEDEIADNILQYLHLNAPQLHLNATQLGCPPSMQQLV